MNGMNCIHELNEMNGIKAEGKKLGSRIGYRVFLKAALALSFSGLYASFSLAQQEPDPYAAQYPQNTSGFQNSAYEPSNQSLDPGHEQAVQGFQKVLEQHEGQVDPYTERSHEAPLTHGNKDYRQGENSAHTDPYYQTEDRNREAPNGHDGSHTGSSQVHDPYRNSKPAEYPEESSRSQHVPTHSETPVQNGEGYHY